MSKSPLVSLIVLFYGQKEITELAVKSLLNTNYANIEIILVDNNSPDDSATYIANQFRGNKKVKVVHNPINNLVAGGYNFGAKFAKGNKLVFFNNDIEVDPDWLTELLKCEVKIKHQPVLIQPKILQFYNPKIIDNYGGLYLYPGIGFGIGSNREDTQIYANTKKVDYDQAIFMVSKSLFEKLGGYDEWFFTHYEDLDFSLRARSLGAICYVCGKSRVYHKGSLTYKKQNDNLLLKYHIKKNRIRTIIKNFNGLNRFIRLFLLLFLIELPCIVYNYLRLRPKSASIIIKAIKSALFS